MTRPSGADLTPFLTHVPLFSGLDAGALALLARVSRLAAIPEGYLIFNQDDPGDAAYVVRQGAVSIVLSTADGRELVINEMGPGDCFGELALLTGAPRSAGAVARADSQVVVIPRAEFLMALEAEPRLMRQMIETLALRLLSSARREGALAFLDAPARLARVLLQLDRVAGSSGKIEISQEELARRAGITRQTAARVLGQWRRQAWLRTGRGRIVLLDRTGLASLAEE